MCGCPHRSPVTKHNFCESETVIVNSWMEGRQMNMKTIRRPQAVCRQCHHSSRGRFQGSSRLAFSIPSFQNNNPHEWLQVDLGKVKRITGVVMQGARSLMTPMMVTEFSVTVSHDKHSWSSVLDENSQREKVPSLWSDCYSYSAVQFTLCSYLSEVLSMSFSPVSFSQLLPFFARSSWETMTQMRKRWLCSIRLCLAASSAFTHWVGSMTSPCVWRFWDAALRRRPEATYWPHWQHLTALQTKMCSSSAFICHNILSAVYGGSSYKNMDYMFIWVKLFFFVTAVRNNVGLAVIFYCLCLSSESEVL